MNWRQHTVQRWLVLQQGANPSTDYYIRPRLEPSGLPIAYRHLDRDIPDAADLAPGTGVVIVRYLNGTWARALHARRALLGSVVYFMDDDLLRPDQWAGLPKPYIKKLNKYCRPFVTDIRQLASTYWFSTDTLYDHYRFQNAQVVEPRPLVSDLCPADKFALPARTQPGPIRLFYHGTAAHNAEIAWLQKVVAEVLQHCAHVHFEIIGNHDINQRYRNLPRTRILHPMSWDNYLSHCRALDGHIGLAPLLPSPFNAGRSHSKAYDIARCGAVGIFSAIGPYKQIISHSTNGMLLANEPQLWIDTLLKLCESPTELARLRLGARSLMQRRHGTADGSASHGVAGL
ncbi:hypothetical protein GG851_22435 [Bordetella petrii]|nr:hypothetical protein [Bordetella petrii]